MSGERMLSYVGGVVENLRPSAAKGDDVKKEKSGSFVAFLTRTAIVGGFVAGSYYLGRDSMKPNGGMIRKVLGKPRENKTKIGQCVLHSYDHCIESIKVELALAFLGVPYKRQLYGFSDASGIKPLKKKPLPVIELKGYANINKASDIIDFLDTNTTHRSFPPETNRKDLKQWLDDTYKIREELVNPRLTDMPVKDWQENEDRRKWEKAHPQRDALDRTFDLIIKIDAKLEQFSNDILYNEFGLNEFGFGMDDLIALPQLRLLTCVKGINWPKKVRSYLQNAFQDTTADLYFKHAKK